MPKSYIMNRVVICSLAIAVSIICVSCHNHDTHKGHDAGEAVAEGHHHDKPGIVHLSPDDAVRFGVSVETVTPGSFCDAIRVTGEIMPSAADAVVISSPTSGLLSLAPGITKGAEVKAGQHIGRVSSKSVSGGDRDAAAKVAVENAKRELDRLKPLLDDGLVTRKEYNEALAVYNSAVSAYSPAAASGAVTASKNGVITEILAKPGEYVETGTPIVSVSGSGTITLRALLPTKDAGFVSQISGAVITPHGAGAESVDISDYNGKILSVSRNSGEAPGYIPVYFTLSSASPLVPGSATEVYLKGNERDGVISVPVASVAEQLGEKFVFVKTGNDDYEKRYVRIGRSDGMRIEITDGIVPGDSVVIGGLSFVRLAEQSTVVPEGHSHNH